MNKITTRLLLLTTLPVITVFSLQAQNPVIQGQIKGRLMNEKQNPAGYATVSLLKAADSTKIKNTVSTEKGDFIFRDILAGIYLLSIEWIGYEKKFIGPFTINSDHQSYTIDDIVLSAASRELNTVRITSKKPLIEHRSDKIIMNIANSTLAAGNSALEILSRAPGVSLDREGNISLKGKSGVNIMIDNKLTYLSREQLTNLLRSTDGNSIETIELMSNPSAKYDASGTAGIINIKLKKKLNYGTNGTITGGGGYGKFYKSNAGITFNHRSKNINIFGSYNYLNDKEFEELNIQRSNTSGTEKTYFDQQTDDIYLRKNNSYKAGIDYDLNDNNTIGLMINGYANNTAISTKNETFIRHQPLVIDSSVVNINPGKSKYRNQTYNLNYKSVIDTSGQEFNADLDYAEFHNTNEILYNNYFYNAVGAPYKTPVIFRNATPTKIKIWSGKADYTYPFGPEMKLETGIKSSYVRTDNDFQFENFEGDTWKNDQTKSNRFIYKEQINAAYANLHKTFKSTTLQAGLRAELTNSEGNSLTTENVVKRSYLDLFPSLFVNQNLSKNHDIGFSYSRRIDRPDYQSLNPFIYFVDLYTFSQGNPSLKPQYANTFELSYGYKKTLNITLGYIHTRDVITTTLLTDTVKKTLLLNDQNLAARDTYNLNISRPAAITSWWNTTNDATLYYSSFSTPDLMGLPFKSDKLTYQLNSVQTFSLSSSLNAELSMNYVSSQVYGTYIAKPIYGMDLGISKSFANKRAMIKLAANDPFNTRKIRISSAVPLQDYTLYQKQESRIFRLTFSYNFGSSVIKAVRERLNGSALEQNRVKSGN